MGLLLGGSVLTVFELIDLIIFNFVKKLMRAPPGGPPPKGGDDATDSESSHKSQGVNQVNSNKNAAQPLEPGFTSADMYESLTKRDTHV